MNSLFSVHFIYFKPQLWLKTTDHIFKKYAVLEILLLEYITEMDPVVIKLLKARSLLTLIMDVNIGCPC